jgi:hypothetical protein
MKSIKTGYPDKGMQPFGTNARLSDRQVLQVASFILSMQGSNPANPKPIDPAREIRFVPEAEKAKEETAQPKDASKPAKTEPAGKQKVAKK